MCAQLIKRFGAAVARWAEDRNLESLRHKLCMCAWLVAQWIAHWTSNPKVAGSNPVKSDQSFAGPLSSDGRAHDS